MWKKVRIRSPELMLHLLQRFSKRSRLVKQTQSLMITNGHLLITDQWINTLLYNALIRSYLCFSSPRISLLLLVQMLRHQSPPNSYTFPSLLKATASLNALTLCSAFNSQCVRRGLFNDPFVRTSFVSAYSHVGDMRSARKVFDEIPQPCIVSYNALLDGLARNGHMSKAVSTFFNMPKRDVYSWTSVIAGYMQRGCFTEAVSFFAKMMVDEDAIHGRLRPSEATFVCILSCCANSDDGSALCQGKQIHGYVIRNNEIGVFVGTALITFYGKMGCLSCAFKVFDLMTVKEVCTWNAMICSLALNGRESEALQMFNRMKTTSLHPNEVTFVGVLSACSRARLVATGMELFQTMSRDFGITPKMEHYGCVVDLLGRSGLLKEAYKFVTSMPFEADASVLGALLGACRVHKDVNLGNEVGHRLLELQPRHCGRYVLLSSIYAEAEKWDHAAALRKAMAHAGIQKVPAFSIAD
ncbi:putative pentatricopeptide repeat-containing protein At1g10330 [Andrographis paniculata]|uniref:putative pentatricopeptide repeat-containing protein At1g10330 n=1 Tax=Andrographis paniculata TaxID=175694 RepID=UPI0021E8C6FB|nr:putative pentatricopeptide repeat-containing protein At1g10330 [Andrographis paniculata]XP_051151467.1 putative pentatricopeptide repeat-containing protein At1g10330 [Andrographis paniculata]XP_051151468.1 putative pentatricopeptide repeat-containing protein At1g10330 [Andrographis paniculata]